MALAPTTQHPHPNSATADPLTIQPSSTTARHTFVGSSLCAVPKGNKPMAHEIQEHDTVMVTGTQAWHGLGIVVEDAPSPDAALQIAGLDWTVDPAPIYAMHEHAPSGEVSRIVCEAHVANVRSDTRDVLGIVGAGYQAIQNKELAELVWKASDEGAIPRVESAGSLKNGRVTFMCSRMETMLVGGKDPLAPFFSLINGNDGTRALLGMGHTHRVVCNNTADFAIFESERTGNIVSLRHTSSIKERIKSIGQMFEGKTQQLAEFKERADALYSRRLNTKEVQRFFLDVYTNHIDHIPPAYTPSLTTTKSDSGMKEDERLRRKAEKTVGSWLMNFESPTCTKNGCSGSAWAALNAVTEWSDHQRTVRTTKMSANATQSRQYANLIGSSKQFKREAAQDALSLLKA